MKPGVVPPKICLHESHFFFFIFTIIFELKNSFPLFAKCHIARFDSKLLAVIKYIYKDYCCSDLEKVIIHLMYEWLHIKFMHGRNFTDVLDHIVPWEQRLNQTNT